MTTKDFQQHHQYSSDYGGDTNTDTDDDGALHRYSEASLGFNDLFAQLEAQKARIHSKKSRRQQQQQQQQQQQPQHEKLKKKHTSKKRHTTTKRRQQQQQHDDVWDNESDDDSSDESLLKLQICVSSSDLTDDHDHENDAMMVQLEAQGVGGNAAEGKTPTTTTNGNHRNHRHRHRITAGTADASTTTSSTTAVSESGAYYADPDMDASAIMIHNLQASQAKMKEEMERMEQRMARMNESFTMSNSMNASHQQRRRGGGGGGGDHHRGEERIPMLLGRTDEGGQVEDPSTEIAMRRFHEYSEEMKEDEEEVMRLSHEVDTHHRRKEKLRSFLDLFKGLGGYESDYSDNKEFGGDDTDPDVTDNTEHRQTRNMRDYMKSMFGLSADGLNNKKEDDFMDTLPEDSFSLMKVSSLHSFAFWSAFTVYIIQVGCYLLLMFNLMEGGYPGNTLNIPANVTLAVRVTQFILLSVAVLSQDPIRTGVALIFKGYTPSIAEVFPNLSPWKFYLIITMRIAEGSLGLAVTALLIFDSEVVIDLLLNFTAMEFISQLDEIFFGLASQGFLGNRMKRPALRIKENKYQVVTVLKDPNNPGAGRQRRGFRLHIILIVTWLALMVAWFIMLIRQTQGVYLCQSFHVQFEDDFVSSLGAFSGIYDIDPSQVGKLASTRVRYVDRESGKAAFAYCEQLNAWSFGFAEDGHFPDPCIDWVAHSDESKTFDILETSDHVWTVRSTDGQVIQIDHFHLECMDCHRREDFAGECHGHGTCRAADAVCECEEGRVGLNCEFDSPCTELEMDIRYGGFQDQRDWSRGFDLFVVDGEPVYAYNRPVYVHEYKPGDYEIVAFTGRRWMATYTEVLLSANLTGVEDPLERSRKLAYYFTDHFHAYWSDFVASFVSEPMHILTEQDGATPVELQWHVAKGKNYVHPHEVQGIDESVAPLDSVFLCRLCNDETNICLNNGYCNDNFHCECMIGSYGSLCQVPPTGNGRCDPEFDLPKYGYDGGDCCESTCVSGDIYHCGKDETGFVDVGYFFCIHEEDEWHLNRASFDGLSSETRYAMAVSSDGHILVLGEPNAAHVTLFDADGSEWVRRGRVLEGPLGSSFGAHVAMSQGLENTVRNYLRVDPVRVVASGRSKRDGFIRIYECLTEGCAQSGSDIVFEGLNAESRTVQDISNDGRIVAFGGFNSTRNSTTVSFYHYEEALDDWTHEGIPDLEFEGDAYALKLSGDFDTLAIRSASIWEAQGDDEYHRKFEATDSKAVFHLNVEKGKWEQVGHTIYHHIDGHGASSNPDDFHILDTRHRLSEFLHGSDPIDISDDGLVMAVGFPFSTTEPGVHVYELDQRVGEWFDRGHTITNNHTDGFKGWSVSLSGDGSVVVIGTGGDETATNTYIWDGLDWNLYGHEIRGGEQSSLALSIDGSVLAVGGETVDVYHRNIKTECPPDMEWFHLSLTLDSHPEDTRWDLVYNATGEVLLSGGPYVGTPDGFPYSNAYERSTIVVEACVPRGECKVFSVYDKIDPLVDVFRTPDGMLAPSIYDFSVDGVEVAKRRLDQACDHYYFGDNCQKCPEDTHALKVLVRSCVPYRWTLTEVSAGQVLVGDNGEDFSIDDFSYIRDGTCQHLGLEVHTYWEEACVKVADLDHDCFHFDLAAHPNWPVVISSYGDIELDHAHRNTEVVLLFDDKQINVDLALVGSLGAGPPSEIHYRYGGACPEGWDTDPPIEDNEILGTYEIVSYNGGPSEAFPLQICQGDCTTDNDCAIGLTCRQSNIEDHRKSFSCAGNLDADIDYCVP